MEFSNKKYHSSVNSVAVSTGKPFFQPKLAISNPNDKYEQEADTMADKVMRMEQPCIQLKPLPIAFMQRKCDHCEEEEKKMQRKEKNEEEITVDDNVENYVGGLSAAGKPLAAETRNFYELRFGYDFSKVKVHTDTVAAKSAQSINALAYTSGTNIVFNTNKYSPNTDSGKKLLGHELTHVVQQGGLGRMIQKAEDWDFTPADYKTLVKAKKDLKFGSDSGWVPKKLQENILTTLRFVLSSSKPARTEGINTKDFYHGHLAVPRAASTTKLDKNIQDFSTKSDELENKGKAGESDVTDKNLKGFSEAMVKIENLATPLVNEALAIKGATVIYHTYESGGPGRMKPGDPARNIKTDIGGSPEGYSPPDMEQAGSYSQDYRPVLQFAFLIDENGVVHATIGTTINLSRVKGKPIGLFD